MQRCFSTKLPGWTLFQDAVLEFTGQTAAADSDPAFAALSRRERETLTLLADGPSNAEIAERLGISEKTVRNRRTHLFDERGAWSRAQAIVFRARARLRAVTCSSDGYGLLTDPRRFPWPRTKTTT